MVFAKVHKFWGVISDVKMAHPRHLPIEVTPPPGNEETSDYANLSYHMSDKEMHLLQNEFNTPIDLIDKRFVLSISSHVTIHLGSFSVIPFFAFISQLCMARNM